jgi:hypothetical protein
MCFTVMLSPPIASLGQEAPAWQRHDRRIREMILAQVP